ncbi:MAG: TIGR03905 family TSCPD domain-containing protein [bacterium]
MKKHLYIPEGVCPTEIHFEIENGILKHVQFEGGCSGNLQALAKLVEGMRIEDVRSKLKGIDCDERGTSCADQLARALETITGESDA